MRDALRWTGVSGTAQAYAQIAGVNRPSDRRAERDHAEPGWTTANHAAALARHRPGRLPRGPPNPTRGTSSRAGRKRRACMGTRCSERHAGHNPHVALTEAVYTVQNAADRAGHHAGGRKSDEDAGDGTDESRQRALAQEQERNLAARRAERPQDADLLASLGDGDRERAVDDEHPHHQRKGAGEIEDEVIDAQDRLEALSPGRGRLHLKSWSNGRPDCRLPLGERDVLGECHIDPIEPPAAAEHLLHRVDVHHSEIAAECPRKAGALQHAAQRRIPVNLGGLELIRSLGPDACGGRHFPAVTMIESGWARRSGSRRSPLGRRSPSNSRGRRGRPSDRRQESGGCPDPPGRCPPSPRSPARRPPPRSTPARARGSLQRIPARRRSPAGPSPRRSA